MSGKEKVVILNGKRFVVGNSKIKSTKCHMDNKRKKILSKEENLVLRKNNRALNRKRKTKRATRKRREEDE